MTIDYKPQEVARAIIASPSLKEAANTLGIHRNSLLKLRKDKRTQAELKKLAQSLFEDSINHAMINANENIDILQRLARGEFGDSQKAWIQLNAIKNLNEIAKYGADLNTIETRLEKIEGLLNEKNI